MQGQTPCKRTETLLRDGCKEMLTSALHNIGLKISIVSKSPSNLRNVVDVLRYRSRRIESFSEENTCTTVRELAHEHGVSKSTVSEHLKKIRKPKLRKLIPHEPKGNKRNGCFEYLNASSVELKRHKRGPYCDV